LKLLESRCSLPLSVVIEGGNDGELPMLDSRFRGNDESKQYQGFLRIHQLSDILYLFMTEEIPPWDFDDEFDGGEETCGRVIVNLYLYIRDQEPGRRILVISRDPGAYVELPAWCRMTDNQLTEMQHPFYLITLKPSLIKE
jgi:TusA-related sulfurtransferase